MAERMMIPPTPTTPSFPVTASLSSPDTPFLSPAEPEFPVERPAQLVGTSFTPQKSPVVDTFSQQTTTLQNTANRSICRRNSLSTPVSATFPPLRTPERAYFAAPGVTAAGHGHTYWQRYGQSNLDLDMDMDRDGNREEGAEEDGRQSRMAMRSPRLKFPRAVRLPLRVNTDARYRAPDDKDIEVGLYRVSEDSDIAHPSIEGNHTEASALISSTVAAASSSPPWLSCTSPTLKRLVRPHMLTSSPLDLRSPIRKRPRLHHAGAGVLTPPPFPPPPRYHVTVVPQQARPPQQALSPTTLGNRAQYLYSVEHLRAPLVPLISVSNGLPHPGFPTSLLQYHLLTHERLDSLARWYHQVVPPVDETFKYPAWIPAWTSYGLLADEGEGAHASSDVDLETKRRRFGRFIGLRGCESPTAGPGGEAPDELARRMEREWKRALERAEEEDRAWEKSWRGRW